jgi:hypothetical protein
MAAIDPNIALGVKPIQIENPMNQYAAMSQIQNAQNQNALAQYQLSATKRAEESQNIQNQLYAKHYNAETGQVNKQGLMADLAAQNQGVLIPKLQAQFIEEEHKQNLNKEVLARTSGLEYTQRMKQYNNAISHIGALNTPQEAIASIKESLAKGDIDQAKADTLVKSLEIAPNFLAWKKKIVLGSMEGKDQLHQQYQEATLAETGRHNIKTEGIQQQGVNIQSGQLNLAQQRLANENNVDLQSKLAEAKSVGTTVGKNKATAIAALPGAIANASEAIRLIDEMVGKPEIRDKKGKIIQNATEPHAGFNTYVGATLTPGLRFIEGTDTAAFELRQKQIEGKAFLEAFNTLRGGGSITEKEGEKGTAAIMRMNKASSPDEYKTAARELQDVLRNGIQIAKTKAGATTGIAPPSGFVPD